VSQTPTNRDGGGWTPVLARALAEYASGSVDLDPSGYELLRFGTNAVFRLSGTPWVLRLRRPGAELVSIERQVSLALWLSKQNFAVNRPAVEIAPMTTGAEGAIASFWEWVKSDPGVDIGVEEFGAILSEFHSLTDGYESGREFPGWNAIVEIEQRLAQAEEGSFLAPEERDLLQQWTEEVKRELAVVEWSLPPGVIHGDAHTGNVLATKRGGVMIDLDALAQGPREWDLVPTAVACLRFRQDLAQVAAFSDAYGFDLLGWDGWPTLRRVRELYMTSWLLTVSTTQERQAEVRHRIETLRADREDVPWHAV
jgi:Ser/Thr protein kinase RdoA (MazF antagonist)